MAPAAALAMVGFDKDVLDLVRTSPGLELVGVFDLADPGGGLPYLGDDAAWAAALNARPGLKVLLAVDGPAQRRRLADHYGADAMLGVVSPAAHVAAGAVVGPGCLIQRGVTVMTDAHIGTGCKLNVNATVHHDSRVGDFCTLAPGALLLGRVTVGDEAYIGAAAVVLQNLRIGRSATIGAGAVVTADVAPGVTVAGVPARPLAD
ncbi:MAG: acetyltransferase [Rhodospirillales bacterium]|jgi:sugar O-acyltransferase (sialic acid O-acetyltransferase NeuD family)|nr:acetyltransferase [Rhodospirillales bacterium]